MTCWSCHKYFECRDYGRLVEGGCEQFIYEPGTDETERVCELCGEPSSQLVTGICQGCWKKYKPMKR